MKSVYKTKTVLAPQVFPRINTDSIFSYNLNSENKDATVFVISDFACPACQNAEKTLANLQEKYSNKVNFRFVYFSDYFSNSALACEAAEKEGKLKEMHDLLFNNAETGLCDSVFFAIAEQIGLDAKTFRKTMNDKSLLLKFLKNRDYLTGLGIYTTPTFIVNEKLLNDSYSINYLEDIIKSELENNE